MTEPLIRWEEGRYADSAYLGEWYIGSIMEVGGFWVASIALPDAAKRTDHSTREGAKEFAEHRVREFLAFAQLPGRI